MIKDIMTRHLAIIGWLITILCIGYADTPSQMIEKNNSAGQMKNMRQEAQRVWEQAIEAEGGRQRMLAIQNLLISSHGASHLASAKNTNHTEKFYVFPNREWVWDDDRPSPFGLRMSMHNWETGMKYEVSLGEPTVKLGPIDQFERAKSTEISGNVTWIGLVLYSLESKWWKPIPQALSFGKIKGREFDVVQTNVSGKRADFFFDQKSHLPKRISFYNFSQFSQTYEVNSVEVSDFVEFDGIKMPTTLKESDGSVYKLDYKINVQYNEEIFQKAPLPIQSAADAWKVKR